MCFAFVGKIISISDDELMPIAKVDINGHVREVNIATIPNAKINDYIIIHAGIGIRIINEDAKLLLSK
ncbi:MAG: hypothetical protein KatS3mg003_2313 [Candidatus Nitrosocaldaceae archaeon]|nr:MAG: hypothetical protein KatS3mg003_1522 [Candidatus Nitrosocaldaceae archaeon]GIU72766.1 MAG: hypothetical protein KatS3mg003_2245 [Candidatus Nitrosocaldaceae archaeon]GIU72834.1 MAG: hypothetical protein KatS3mg003_2313 [Candidatus Nitrosocaldaceae archaeon]